MDNKANKMLIDATHPEETRVVVLRNGRVEEFDFESAARAQLRGNIYLAKVTRVEPSLQAAFVEYGGNRHGFLAFNEIHPDYYQIPMADKQALLEEEARAEAEADAEADARAERRASRQRHSDNDGEHDHDSHDGDDDAQPMSASLNGDGDADGDDAPRMQALEARADEPVVIELPAPPADATVDEQQPISDAGASSIGSGLDDVRDDDVSASTHIEEVAEVADAPETIGSDAGEDQDDDVVEEVQERPRRPRRRIYKIQEVIKRRQVILVQVVKEERGNKGAALTTYLSLAGRYTVLMPNTGRGGGISRKITNAVDRKRLKSIAQELDVPEGMGLIIRTAGAARTNQEIKRDYEYLLRLWESVRDLTLNSTAPSLVYEEGNLIKRSIRDLYSKEIDEIVVAGDAAHAEAVDFMRMLMPSHAKNVVRHSAPEALFARYQIERQLNAFFSPQVTLRSGGYIVINQTEALVAIDVNSGKSTREYSIEETALNTNLEAADEIARQLKLRDLAGLIVVDFIDMEEKRNNRAVERRLKDALRFDRARIQVGRISHFGLLEMSRQRMRTGMLEGSTSQCPHCQGTGMIRSTESVALAVLRGLEDHLNKDPRSSVAVLTTAHVALYILNNKRQFISDIEDRFGVAVAVQASDRMHGANYAIERSSAPPPARRQPVRPAVSMDWGFEDEDNEPPSETHSNVDVVESDDDYDDRPSNAARTDDNGDREEGREGGRRRRRRRRRGRDRDREGRPHDQANGDSHGSHSRHDQDELSDDGDESEGTSQPGANGDSDRQRRDDASYDEQRADDAEGGDPERDEAGRDGDDRQGEQGDGRRRRRRRRGRRGGRRGREGDQPLAADADDQPEADEDTSFSTGADNDDGVTGDSAPSASDTPSKANGAPPADEPTTAPAPVVATVSEPIRVITTAANDEQAAASSEPAATAKSKVAVTELPAEPDEPGRPVRRGWWQRRILGE